MINFKYGNEDIIDYEFDDITIKKINKNIKIILNDVKDTKKAYIFQNGNNDFPKNRINKALFNIKEMIMETPTFGDNDCDLKPQHYLDNDDDYTAFVFSKDKNILKMSAIGSLSKKYHTHMPDGELYFSKLCGQGGAGLIFDLIKKIIENGGQNEMVNLKDVKYLDLTAIPSYKTLNFYNKKNGLVPSNEIFNDNDNYGYNDYMIQLLKIMITMLYTPEYNELIKNLDPKSVNEFWDLYIQSHLKFIDYIFFYDTKKSEKVKEEFNQYFNKLNPIEDLKNTIDIFDNDEQNKKMFDNLKKEINQELKKFYKLLDESNINKKQLDEINMLLQNTDKDNIFEVEDTINYIKQQYL
jgi:hypothetical protein